MSVKEIVYLSRDNTVDLLLKADGVAQNLSSVTRMIVKQENDDWAIDSDVYSDAFDWAPGVTGKVILDLADAMAAGNENVPAATYMVRLVVYDPTNTNGVVWSTFVIIVK